MTKTLHQIIFFFLHQNQNIFFSNIGNQNILTRDSFVSATVREWNNLNLSVRNLDTLSKFKKAIRSSISMPIRDTILMVLEN